MPREAIWFLRYLNITIPNFYPLKYLMYALKAITAHHQPTFLLTTSPHNSYENWLHFRVLISYLFRVLISYLLWSKLDGIDLDNIYFQQHTRIRTIELLRKTPGQYPTVDSNLLRWNWIAYQGLRAATFPFGYAKFYDKDILL